MSDYTDKNVPMECPECPNGAWEEGIDNMLRHVLETHQNLYSLKEALSAVKSWAEDAHEENENWNFEHRLDRSISADAFPMK